ncbi:hypothetical protein EYF80_028730 [Liparis tanakae]|uniref:Uncharacterized protein n=1 Tax=Liparis tanakae TaxID=230148 RepID=A0A4Z2H5D9_9TELE|nr:hypothetical protein EYF80_028730 [Liparis tanakae]
MDGASDPPNLLEPKSHRAITGAFVRDARNGRESEDGPRRAVGRARRGLECKEDVSALGGVLGVGMMEETALEKKEAVPQLRQHEPRCPHRGGIKRSLEFCCIPRGRKAKGAEEPEIDLRGRDIRKSSSVRIHSALVSRGVSPGQLANRRRDRVPEIQPAPLGEPRLPRLPAAP